MPGTQDVRPFYLLRFLSVSLEVQALDDVGTPWNVSLVVPIKMALAPAPSHWTDATIPGISRGVYVRAQ